jgi:hypothetical protein
MVRQSGRRTWIAARFVCHVDLLENPQWFGMEARTDSFLRELEQMMAQRLVCLVAFIVSVIEIFGKMRFVVAANLIDDEFTRVRIGHVIVQEVEEGDPNSLDHLYFKGLEEEPCSLGYEEEEKDERQRKR